ncbi:MULTISPECIES: hypothetical protein [Acinetobacter]|jgi:hypothetical protein|uniref:Uncharacterized protein n=2 Tax=Acinetobacter parvus TaxID=134533 RepID=N8Q234_9GAMM|nr:MULTISPECIES: hypothetical protein [Acinetobacter]MBP6274593.1 hypothetical protein [Acinetobacter sp.]ENU32530.1 hypothetical protein F989_02513 [Acinetobacter parvus NIPH 1103]ENU36780.1 hypothetical protein F988_01059 [Acinetobacter parvus DSM 16617 = CIP 108168]ENU86437.1 hypothetical protein F973_01356 [Acinetobacter sp. CIP 102129]ENU90084.1 hypothetical protein F972_00650 [Acinetobacter sp. CIP 102529]
MNTAVFLNIHADTYARFAHIRAQLLQGSKESQANALGNVLSEMACEVIEQVFMVLLQENQHHSQTGESEKVIQQILEAIRKYMPWSVSFFGNDRLVPVVEYLSKTIQLEDEKVYMTYPIEQQLAQQVKSSSHKLAGGDRHETVNALKLLTDVIDVGVTHLIREPKKCLKFNFVVDKTLNGVINMTTHLGYKRLEKLGTQLDQQVAVIYVDYFLKFMRHQA